MVHVLAVSNCSQVSWHRHESSLGLPAARLKLVETGEVSEGAEVRSPRMPR